METLCSIKDQPGGFNAWLRYWGLSDHVTRSNEKIALLYACTSTTTKTITRVPLTPLEWEVLYLERIFVTHFKTQPFIDKNGSLSPGQKYAWIAAHYRGELSPLQIRGILEDVTYALEFERREDAIVAWAKREGLTFVPIAAPVAVGP